MYLTPAPETVHCCSVRRHSVSLHKWRQVIGVFFFSSRRRHTRCREVSWARRCVQETGSAGTFHNIQSKQMSRDYKGANWKAESKSVDPKEMTNEQLEEILRTGSVFSKYSERASDSSFNPVASVNSPKNQGSSLEPKKAFGQMQKQLLTGSEEFTQPKFSNKLLETGLGEKFDTPDRKPEKASSRLQSSSSKAYTTAMKALQEKLKQLERENAHYKAREKLSNEEQGRMQQRTRDELSLIHI
eukprot:TRINITY_DN43009_c0_g1_i3.p1 TRINITY_DN43009_c0_g1~~TRINITY_DN43009_c0_g1_i3.p1  ORF type:complete len:243 (+),score=57.73 TRINITY_DN43009_c0_g1_i3:48-776(+)